MSGFDSGLDPSAGPVDMVLSCSIRENTGREKMLGNLSHAGVLISIVSADYNEAVGDVKGKTCGDVMRHDSVKTGIQPRSDCELRILCEMVTQTQPRLPLTV